MTDPIVSRNKADRTGANPIIRRLDADAARRFRAAKLSIIEALDFVYLTPQDLIGLNDQVQRILDRWLLEGRSPDSFWAAEYTNEAALKGAKQANANLVKLSAAYAVKRPLEAILYSDGYLTRLALARIASYSHWSDLAAATQGKIAELVTNAIADGKNPKAAAPGIAEALGVSRSKAATIAQTDILGTLRDARIVEADVAEKQFGFKLGLLWTSALIPTTRKDHASRNGKVYTRAEVQEFYGKNGNKYNCHCALTECLLDADDNPLLSDTLKASMRDEKDRWQADNV